MATGDRLLPSADEAMVLGHGLTCGPGDLPHLDLDAAVEFSVQASTIPTLPTLPRMAPAQSELHQALVGIDGVRPGPYGTLSIDVGALDPDAPVTTDFAGGTFGGFASTLDRLAGCGGVSTVKWQLAGPVAIAEAIHRAGADVALAFAVGRAAAQRRMNDVSSWVAERLPNAHQLIVVDELDLDEWVARRSVASGDVLDAVSSALAAGGTHSTVAVTGPRSSSVATLIETGPHLVGLRSGGLGEWAGRVARFVDAGGGLLWQIGRASGPMTEPLRRSRARLARTVGVLAAAGADLDQVASRSVITTDGGLAGHDVASATQVMAALDRLAVYFQSGSALFGAVASVAIDPT